MWACICVGIHMAKYPCVSRTSCRSWFSPSTMWVPGHQVEVISLVGSTFALWPISPVHIFCRHHLKRAQGPLCSFEPRKTNTQEFWAVTHLYHSGPGLGTQREHWQSHDVSRKGPKQTAGSRQLLFLNEARSQLCEQCILNISDLFSGRNRSCLCMEIREKPRHTWKPRQSPMQTFPSAR